MTAYLEYNGQPVDIHDLLWAGFAPCGCINSSLNASADGGILTAESAKRFHADGSKLREFRDPNTYRLISRADFPWDEFKGECPHSPKWGRPEIPIPDGYEWAVGDPARGLQHFIPSGPRDWSKPAPDALCGSRRHWWNRDEDARNLTVPCLKCAALAEKQAQA